MSDHMEHEVQVKLTLVQDSLFFELSG
jgi:hypothetical protein